MKKNVATSEGICFWFLETRFYKFVFKVKAMRAKNKVSQFAASMISLLKVFLIRSTIYFI